MTVDELEVNTAFEMVLEMSVVADVALGKGLSFPIEAIPV